LTWADIIAPGLALGQAIGRWGNFFNQEVYGKPTNLPWGIKIDLAHRLPGFENVERYHPTFFYEFLWNLLNMFVLLWVARKFKEKLKPGDIFFLYLIIYSFGRFMLEFIRIVNSPIAGINSNQALMGFIFIASMIVMFVRHKRPSKEEVVSK
jgi:phosphatidylglycerol:prolipoprotein diacylglycerol transferase